MVSQGDRLLNLENEVKYLKEGNSVEHKEVKECLSKINDKLDRAIEKKADKDTVVNLSSEITKMKDNNYNRSWQAFAQALLRSPAVRSPGCQSLPDIPHKHIYRTQSA